MALIADTKTMREILANECVKNIRQEKLIDKCIDCDVDMEYTWELCKSCEVMKNERRKRKEKS